MDQVTQQNAAMVEEATAAASSLTGEADQMASLMRQFRLGTGSVAVVSDRGRPQARPSARAARVPWLENVAADEMALGVEGVVDGGLHRAEFLECLHPAKALHGPLSSSERLVWVLSVERQPVSIWAQ